MRTVLAFVTVLLIGAAEASPRCTGFPRRLGNKKCATTTHYADYHKGACGCGPDNGDTQVWWNHKDYAAAANQLLFDSGNKGWCGQTCGKCVKLTPTGGFVDGQGSAPRDMGSKVFMVTNLCPNEYPNLSWCSQTPGHQNQYGYEYHFDLEDGVGQIDALGWSNPEVTWEFVNCDGHNLTPSNGLYHRDCYCGKHGKK